MLDNNLIRVLAACETMVIIIIIIIIYLYGNTYY